jgi:DNA-binding CsgD family transcriptional regulator
VGVLGLILVTVRHTLRNVALVVVAFNTVLYAGLAAYALIVATRTQSWSVRWLWWLVALPAAAVVVGGLHRIAIQSARVGWLPADRLDLLLHEWQIVKSLATAAIGIAAFLGMRHLAGRFSDLEWVVGEVLDRAQKVDLDALELTAREREVLDVISASSRIDDKTLAEKLSVAPGTVHTYVRTLLRKTKLRDRRDLAVVAFLLKTRHDGPSTPRR